LRAHVKGIRLVVSHSHAHDDDFVAHAVDLEQEFHAALAVLVSEGVASAVRIPFSGKRLCLSCIGLRFDTVVFTQTDESRADRKHAGVCG
jgi:hypothetical protein